jgi:hypothetical protein
MSRSRHHLIRSDLQQCSRSVVYVPIERISRLVGHSSTVTTEMIYRRQIRPVIEHGADVMDRIFPAVTDHEA